MTERNTVTHICTMAEADKLLRSTRGKGYVYWIGVSRELPIPESEGKCFPGYGVLKVSLRDARDFARQILGDILERRGGRIKIEIVDGKHVYL